MNNPSKIGESYHDVTVVVDGVNYNLFNSKLGLSLQCCRVGGWQLWDLSQGKGNEVQIGGEYHGNKEFKILINGIIICESIEEEGNYD